MVIARTRDSDGRSRRWRTVASGLYDLGITVATGSLRGPDGPELVAAYGEHIIPEISTW